MKVAENPSVTAKSRRPVEHSSFRRFSFLPFSSIQIPLFPRNPLFPALRSGHRLFQRPSHRKQIPSSALALNFNGSDGAPGTFVGNTLTFTKRQAAIDNEDVSWVIETSETLAPGSWSDAVLQNPGNTDPTIFFTLPTGEEKIFGRLKVIQQP